MKELTEVLKDPEFEWLADVPRNVLDQLLKELAKAWERGFKKISKPPHFKRKGRDNVSLIEPHPRYWRVTEEGDVRFPKLGVLKTKMHRPLEGKGKTCALVREADQWFVSISCEVEIEERLRKPGRVGLDRGVKHLVADSDRNVFDGPEGMRTSTQRLTRAQRALSKKKKGSNNHRKAQLRVARLHRKVRRQRNHLLHQIALHYAKSHGTVVIEDLQVKNMTKSASGTSELPGRNVRQKAGLNRSILNSGWGLLAWMIQYKLDWAGGTLIKVPPHYTSQTCSCCETVDAASRISQSEFICTACGHADNADVNAAKVILSRGDHGIAVCGGYPVGGPMKQKQRGVSPAQLSLGPEGHKAPPFREG
jgi:putative transposase